MGPLVPEILQVRQAIENKMKFAFFFLLGGSILLISAEKHNERSWPKQSMGLLKQVTAAISIQHALKLPPGGYLIKLRQIVHEYVIM